MTQEQKTWQWRKASSQTDGKVNSKWSINDSHAPGLIGDDGFLYAVAPKSITNLNEASIVHLYLSIGLDQKGFEKKVLDIPLMNQ